MSEFRPSNAAPLPSNAALCTSIRDRILLGLVLLILVDAGEALAGDQASVADSKLGPVVGDFHLWSASSTAAAAHPGVFTAPAVDSIKVFSTTEFVPRKHTIFDRDPGANIFGDAPLLRTTTVWERMSDYRSHDRVQVLTLWESSGSTVSLQAGKRGDPSLQWTSRLMNHGGSTQGLLDRLFSVSLAGASAGLHNVTRSTSAPPPPKPASVAVAASPK
jgi:hypothetical protein